MQVYFAPAFPRLFKRLGPKVKERARATVVKVADFYETGDKTGGLGMMSRIFLSKHDRRRRFQNSTRKQLGSHRLPSRVSAEVELYFYDTGGWFEGIKRSRCRAIG